MAESAFSERIVQNLLDTDFYKLTMMQAVLHNYPNAEVEWEFRCRNQEDLRLYLPAIREQLEYLAGLAISDEQLAFLERIPFLAPDFIRFLGLFRFNPRYVQTGIENDEFFLRLKGPWLHVILFEVPLLAMISECATAPATRPPPSSRRANACRKSSIGCAGRPAPRNWPASRWPTSVPPPLLLSGPRGGGERSEGGLSGLLRRHQQRPPGTQARPQAPRHHGPRMADGPPAARSAPDRQPECRVGLLGPRIPWAARHRADRLHHHRCLPARLRPLFRQALRRPPPRLGRPIAVGGKDHRPLPQAGHQTR